MSYLLHIGDVDMLRGVRYVFSSKRIQCVCDYITITCVGVMCNRDVSVGDAQLIFFQLFLLFDRDDNSNSLDRSIDVSENVF